MTWSRRIDLATHWVADEGLGQPDEAGSAFDVLADHGVIDRDTATALRGATVSAIALHVVTQCWTTAGCMGRQKPASPRCAASWQ